MTRITNAILFSACIVLMLSSLVSQASAAGTGAGKVTFNPFNYTRKIN